MKIGRLFCASDAAAMLASRNERGNAMKRYAGPNKTWPIDTEKHIKAALGFYNAGDGKDKHTADKWEQIGCEIAVAATATLQERHEEKNGKVVRIGGDATAELDSRDAAAQTSEDLDRAAMLTNPYPTLLEIATGDYKKGRVDVGGILVDIESPRGSVRSGTAPDGHFWYSVLANHYGDFVNGTPGADGDQVDCFLGDDPTSPCAFVIDQIYPANWSFDEHKVILGVRSADEARNLYLANYAEGWQGCGSITEMSMDALKTWLMEGDHSQPVGNWPNNPATAKVPLDANSQAQSDSSRGSLRDATAELGSRDASAYLDVLYPEAGQWRILSDGNGPLRVGQLLTIADAVNLNDRIYPHDVLQAAITRARPRAKAGAMLMELAHPEAVTTRSGAEKFVDNPERKSARIDRIADPDANGMVWFEYTVLDVDCGPEVAQAFRAGTPYGVSIRFSMPPGRMATVAGRQVEIAKAMDISTADHVTNPAVPQTRQQYQLLTDSVRAELGLPAPTHVAQAKPSPKGLVMNPKLKIALGGLWALIGAKASADQVVAARKVVSDEITIAHRAGEDVSEATMQALKADEAMEKIGQYRPGGANLIGIPGSQTGAGGGPGYGAGLEQGATDPAQPTPTGHNGMSADAFTKEDIAWMREERKRHADAASDALRRGQIQTACDGLATGVLAGLPVEDQDFIVGTVLATATDASQVVRLATDHSDRLQKRLAAERLKGGGYDPNSNARGRTVVDPANPVNGNHQPAYVTRSARPWMAAVDQMIAATDDYARVTGAEIDPRDPSVQKNRKFNRENYIDGWIEQYAQRFAGCKTAKDWFARDDAFEAKGEKALLDSVQEKYRGKLDETTISNVNNIPSVAAFMLIQSYWDMGFLKHTAGIGPGDNIGLGGWTQQEGIGSVLKVPVETYQNATNYGSYDNSYDAGALTPEGVGIDPSSVSLRLLTYAPSFRRFAVDITAEALKSIGNGPLNIPLLSRHFYHIAADKSRRIDRGLGNEMFQIADEYGAVLVTTEAPSLANNSVYGAGGAITVNLNMNKLASAAVAPNADPFATYGANVVGAARVVGANAGPTYGGTAGGYASPVVRQRTTKNLDQNGAAIQVVTTPFAITGAGMGGAVQGYLGQDGQVHDDILTGNTGSNFAVDFNNGVVVFTAAFPSIAGAAGVLTAPAAMRLTYYYATNFSEFQVNNVTLPTGITYETYLNGLVRAVEKRAALMGSPGRYVKPNLGMMSLNSAVNLRNAAIFYQWASPAGTELMPTDDYFASRSGMRFAEYNAPIWAADQRLLLSREGSTKYGVDVPWEYRGPLAKYDTQGRPIDAEIYYARENSVIATPQVIDVNGNVIQPVSSYVMLR
jgi:Inorganic Pyrophosphatase